MSKRKCKFEGSHYGELVKLDGVLACKRHWYRFLVDSAEQSKNPVKRKQFFEKAMKLIESLGANESVFEIVFKGHS